MSSETEADRVRKQAILIRKEVQGFDIYYQYKKFKAVKDNIVLEAPTQDKVETFIKDHLAETRRFKPLDVIKIADCTVGKITSRVADSEKEIFFSFRDKEDTEKATPKHTKEMLINYGWSDHEKDKSNFVELTEKNQKILAEIQGRHQDIESAKRDIAHLKTQFEKPVTWERLEKAAGGKQ